MWPKRQNIARRLERDLSAHSASVRHLPGIATQAALETLAMQMVASLRRHDYTRIMLQRVSPLRADPKSALFDPERAAIYHAANGNLDEAVWLIFLATHFGKHGAHGWTRVRDVYSGLGAITWTWAAVSAQPNAFRAWLQANHHYVGGAFGNHRKYESLNPASTASTANVIDSYLAWVGPSRSHVAHFANLVRIGGNHQHAIFDHFYKTMNVLRFGRLGKFDFLAQLGRLGLAPIEPGKAYLVGATGPQRGARLLLGGTATAKLNINDMENWLQRLDADLGVGMQVMEDSLCNWQKSPDVFVHFTG